MLVLSLGSRTQGSYNQNMAVFLQLIRTADPFANKLNLVVHDHQQKCCEKFALLCSGSRSQQRFRTSLNPECLFGGYVLNDLSFYDTHT